ncbi:MAG TPA: hypothetical protein DEO49_02740 [Sutterella sp.]|jgi:ABC-type transport system involved in cytochrome bd biosynthesis fused ATPase/permease subunit|nr:hypothetical protein [Sutterella sp.]
MKNPDPKTESLSSKCLRAAALVIVCSLCLSVVLLAASVALGMVAVAVLSVIGAYALKPEETRMVFRALGAQVGALREAALQFVSAMSEIVRTMSEAARAFTEQGEKGSADADPARSGENSSQTAQARQKIGSD